MRHAAYAVRPKASGDARETACLYFDPPFKTSTLDESVGVDSFFISATTHIHSLLEGSTEFMVNSLNSLTMYLGNATTMLHGTSGQFEDVPPFPFGLKNFNANMYISPTRLLKTTKVTSAHVFLSLTYTSRWSKFGGKYFGAADSTSVMYPNVAEVMAVNFFTAFVRCPIDYVPNAGSFYNITFVNRKIIGYAPTSTGFAPRQEVIATGGGTVFSGWDSAPLLADQWITIPQMTGGIYPLPMGANAKGTGVFAIKMSFPEYTFNAFKYVYAIHVGAEIIGADEDYDFNVFPGSVRVLGFKLIGSQ